MPLGIAINHLNTPRRIPQAALQKEQLSGQADLLQSVYNVRSDLFLNCLESLLKSVKQFGSRSGPTTCHTSNQNFCKAYQQTTQTGLK